MGPSGLKLQLDYYKVFFFQKLLLWCFSDPQTVLWGHCLRSLNFEFYHYSSTIVQIQVHDFFRKSWFGILCDQSGGSIQISFIKSRLTVILYQGCFVGFEVKMRLQICFGLIVRVTFYGLFDEETPRNSQFYHKKPSISCKLFYFKFKPCE